MPPGPLGNTLVANCTEGSLFKGTLAGKLILPGECSLLKNTENSGETETTFSGVY